MKKAIYEKALKKDIENLTQVLSPNEVIEARTVSVDNSIVEFEKLHKKAAGQLKKANSLLVEIRNACKQDMLSNTSESATKILNEMRVFEAKLGKYLEVAKEPGVNIDEREALIGVMVELADTMTENTSEQAEDLAGRLIEINQQSGDEHDRNIK